MTTVLFVCTGNTCRSPIAEALARRQGDRLGLKLRVASAGTFAITGAPATASALRAAGRRGADLSAHRSRHLERSMVCEADLSVAMTPAHRDEILRLGGTEDRVFLATDFLPPEDGRRGAPVPDPLGGDETVYEETTLLLQACMSGLLDYIRLRT